MPTKHVGFLDDVIVHGDFTRASNSRLPSAVLVSFCRSDFSHLRDYPRYHWRIWGGGMPGTRLPLWDPILSFLQTFLAKSARIGGPRPPLTGARPPYGKSWIRHWLYLDMLTLSIIRPPIL